MGGALGVLRAINRAIPILHTSAGCGSNLFGGMNNGSAYIGGGYCGGLALPSTNVIERDIVFGGDEHLREQIKTTLEVMDGDLYVVLTGCMVEMIGDDVDAVCSEYADADVPLIAVHTPSFQGDSLDGYDTLLSAFAKKLVPRGQETIPATVNILGIIPGQDVFWEGNLKELKRLLALIGVRANTLFGEGETIADIRRSGSAALNVVVSDTYGVRTAQEYEELHGIPFITTGLPIGITDTETFLCAVAAALGIAPEVVTQALAPERRTYYAYIERLADLYNDVDLQRYAIIVGDANYVPPISKFVADELGWIPRLAVITDQIKDDDVKDNLLARFRDYESAVAPDVRFNTDASSIKHYIAELFPQNHNDRYTDLYNQVVVIGSSIERGIADEYGYPLLTATFPVTNRLVFGRAYAGLNGALTLVEDLISAVISGR
jgi:nitrogenase molybdenum-iron protein beta chain